MAAPYCLLNKNWDGFSPFSIISPHPIHPSLFFTNKLLLRQSIFPSALQPAPYYHECLWCVLSFDIFIATVLPDPFLVIHICSSVILAIQSDYSQLSFLTPYSELTHYEMFPLCWGMMEDSMEKYKSRHNFFHFLTPYLPAEESAWNKRQAKQKKYVNWIMWA